MEKDQNINPEVQNEEVKEAETEEQILEGQTDLTEKNSLYFSVYFLKYL